ncbi:hypothetical protein Dimus_037936 [Dionaea muscipula]
MDMDMDMDIPQADELEWLEKTHSALDEEYLLEELDGDGEEEKGENDHQLHPFPPPGESALAPSPAQPTHHAGNRKRPRPDARVGVEEEPSSRKRSSNVAETCGDDDILLQLSPLHPNAGSPVAEDEPEMFLSRYAWEIDGDCMPVTAPCGERVYAKVAKAAATEKSTPASRKFSVSSHCRGGNLRSTPISPILSTGCLICLQSHVLYQIKHRGGFPFVFLGSIKVLVYRVSLLLATLLPCHQNHFSPCELQVLFQSLSAHYFKEQSRMHS